MFQTSKTLRTVFFIVGIFGALAGPPWLPFATIVLSMLRWGAWEAVLVGLLVDLLWLPSLFAFPVYTVTSLTLLWIFEPMRRQFFYL